MYCQNCGANIASNANFCPNCGKSVTTTALSTSYNTTIASSGNGDYRLVLVDNGSCTKNNTEELLCDLLGYNEEDADRFVEYAPVEVADNLSELQARTLAQVFTEYGCQMLVMDDQGDIVDIDDKADSSVFDLDGNLLAKAAAIIAGLTPLIKDLTALWLIIFSEIITINIIIMNAGNTTPRVARNAPRIPP